MSLSNLCSAQGPRSEVTFRVQDFKYSIRPVSALELQWIDGRLTNYVNLLIHKTNVNAEKQELHKLTMINKRTLCNDVDKPNYILGL